MKKHIFAISMAILAGQAMAQNEYDALRFSQTYQQGTARSAAMGGAFGALGGDVSVLATNPAGIAIYRSGEFCASLDVMSNKVESSFNNYATDESKFSMKIPNFGFVLASGNGATTGFTSWSFGIGFNRLNDFSLNESFKLPNATSSLLDARCGIADGIHPDDLISADDLVDRAFYESYLIDDFNPDGDEDEICYTNDLRENGYGQTIERNAKTRGGINSWDFAFAGSFNEMVYFGASLGVQSINYKSESVHSEDDVNNTSSAQGGKPGIGYFDFVENKKITGGGINLKAGVIVKPNANLRFGAAIHTPTLYSLTEKSDYTLKSVLDTKPEGEKKQMFDYRIPYDFPYDNGDRDDYYQNEYKLVTPFKAILSAAYILPGYGLVSFDYERTNCSQSKFESEDFTGNPYRDANYAIKNRFQATNNFRVGLEGLAGPMAIRAGYALYGNPCKYVSGNKQRQIISGGLGIKGNNDFYIDLTAAFHIYESDAYMYETYLHNEFREDQSLKNHYNNRYLHIMMTVGVKF